MTEDLDAYTIPEFSRRHRFSRATYYNLAPEDRPRETRIGSRVIITREDAAAWRQRMAERSTAPRAA